MGRRRKFVRFHRPWLAPAELEAVVDAITVQAPSAQQTITALETAFAGYVRSSYAVATTSHVAALAVSLDTLTLERDDEVIMSVYGSSAAPPLLLDHGVRPILVDVKPGTFAMDPAQVERRITGRTRAVLAAHAGGFPCDMDVMMQLAVTHRLRLVEDAGDAFPAWHHGLTVGCIGDLAVFQFDPIPPWTSEGLGMVTTDRDDHCRRLQATLARTGSTPTPRHLADAASRISTLQAATALERLRRADLLHGIRRYFAEVYDLGLSDVAGLRLPDPGQNGTEPAWTQYPVRLDVEGLGMDAKAFVRALRAERIEAMRLPAPLNVRAEWRAGKERGDFPNAGAAHAATVLLPLDARMTEVDVWDVIDAIRRICGTASSTEDAPDPPPATAPGGLSTGATHGRRPCGRPTRSA